MASAHLSAGNAVQKQGRARESNLEGRLIRTYDCLLAFPCDQCETWILCISVDCSSSTGVVCYVQAPQDRQQDLRRCYLPQVCQKQVSGSSYKCRNGCSLVSSFTLAGFLLRFLVTLLVFRPMALISLCHKLMVLIHCQNIAK